MHVIARVAAGLFVSVVVFCAAGVSAARATDLAKVKFDLPSGDARPMLRQFAAQTKREIIFAVDVVDGVSTKPVRGYFTQREALETMLRDTGLVASFDPKSGAIAVRREAANEGKNATQPN